MNYAQLLEDARYEVTHFFNGHAQESLLYHNAQHTEYVVLKAIEIARFYKLDDKDFFAIVAAAWFHDTGYYTGGAQEHEIRSATMAKGFLKAKSVDDTIIEQVERCIMATVMPQQPHNLDEQILCDADLYHLGTEQFSELNKKMRKEEEWRRGKKIGKQDWRVETLKLMESHRYQTDYAKNLLENKKQENMERLKRKEVEDSIDDAVMPAILPAITPVTQPAAPAAIAAKKDKAGQAGAGNRNHVPHQFQYQPAP